MGETYVYVDVDIDVGCYVACYVTTPRKCAAFMDSVLKGDLPFTQPVAYALERAADLIPSHPQEQSCSDADEEESDIVPFVGQDPLLQYVPDAADREQHDRVDAVPKQSRPVSVMRPREAAIGNDGVAFEQYGSPCHEEADEPGKPHYGEHHHEGERADEHITAEFTQILGFM